MSTGELDVTIDGGGDRGSGELEPGAQLGKYKLERVIGRGGMGVVWSAHDPDLERSVALKVLRRADAGQELRARLLREARAMARLKHPNVLTVYEVGSAGDRDYIAMELVDGTNLDRWLSTRPPVSEVISAILAAGRGLAAAHDAGLVHRDFKPHNVLRGRDGRVLVTDFGLARGVEHGGGSPTPTLTPTPTPTPGAALDETMEATPEVPHKTDSVLDSTLTKTGALIGTPAYMAPEQFLGAPPDPRTDQFAFCVTAWQALAGERPFRGQTFDELRTAASAGVANVKAKLPRGVRDVLARGLDPAPESRWANLDELLAAFATAHRPRRWTAARIASAIFVLAAVGALAFKLFVQKQDAVPAPHYTVSGCTSPDEALAEAWTPERRIAIQARLGTHRSFPLAADALDRIREDWLHAYAAVCTGPASTVALARLTCLLGERDEVATFARLLETIPPDAFDGVDMWGQLPRVAACETNSPVTPPLMPDDRKQRDRIVALRARIAALRLSSPFEFDKHVDELLGAARSIGWKPAEAEIYMAAGNAAQLTFRDDDALAAYDHAVELAEEQHDYRLAAQARIEQLGMETQTSAQPGEDGREMRMVEQARTAVQRAGDDPALALAIDDVVASTDVEQGRYDRAVPTLEGCRKRFLELHGERQAAAAASAEIRALVRRNRPGDLDTAWQLGTATEHAVAANERALALLASEMIDLAERRGELDEAHARADRLERHDSPVETIEITGHVVGSDGKPAAGATVVAWQGTLVGDAKRLYVRPDLTFAVVTCDGDGAFTVKAPAKAALIAELGPERSLPVVLPDKPGKPLTVKLLATRGVTGEVAVDPDNSGGLDAGVRLAAGDHVWIDSAPVARGGGFKLAGVPVGDVRASVERDGHRVSAYVWGGHSELVWPRPRIVDAIVRTPQHGRLTLYVLHSHQNPSNKAQLDKAISQASDVFTRGAEPVGFATQTRVMFAKDSTLRYQPGDVHAVVRDNNPGDVTLCALVEDTGKILGCTSGAVQPDADLPLVLITK